MIHWHCSRHDGGPVGWITETNADSSDCWDCGQPGTQGFVGAKAALAAYEAHRTHYQTLNLGEPAA